MSKIQYTEAKAIEIIDEYLGGLTDDNARLRVINWACQKFSVNPVQVGNNPAASQVVGAQVTPDLSDFKGFMNLKKPKDGNQRLACLAYFLEKKKDIKEFNVKDLKQANIDAKQTSISNFSVYLDNATSHYGFFAPTKGGKKCLTSRGEAIVEALPDQDKVKQALNEHKYRAKTKHKGKAKKS